ncbi:TPA: hypothetical protein U6I48_004773 [Klebsiella aerogenes]|nr:hypothetical protein [Klebsiella aerogenes]
MRNAIVSPPITNTVYANSIIDRDGGSARKILPVTGRTLFCRQKQMQIDHAGGFENTFQCFGGAGAGRG